jgi:hypothetical protein
VKKIVNTKTFPTYLEKYEIQVEITRSNTSAVKSKATKRALVHCISIALNVHSFFVFVKKAAEN